MVRLDARLRRGALSGRPGLEFQVVRVRLLGSERRGRSGERQRDRRGGGGGGRRGKRQHFKHQGQRPARRLRGGGERRECHPGLHVLCPACDGRESRGPPEVLHRLHVGLSNRPPRPAAGASLEVRSAGLDGGEQEGCVCVRERARLCVRACLTCELNTLLLWRCVRVCVRARCVCVIFMPMHVHFYVCALIRSPLKISPSLHMHGG